MDWSALYGTSDGSDLYSGDPSGSTAAGVPTLNTYSLPGDMFDNQQMQAWNTAPAPAQAAGATWWQGLVMNGVSKAIDNTFPTSPTGVMGNTYPGSAAGLNGATYAQKPTGAGGGVLTLNGSMNGSIGGIPVLLLVGAAVLLYALR